MTLDSGGRPHVVGYQWGTAFLCQNANICHKRSSSVSYFGILGVTAITNVSLCFGWGTDWGAMSQVQHGQCPSHNCITDHLIICCERFHILRSHDFAVLFEGPAPRCCALRWLLWCLSLSVRWWPPGLSSRWEYYLCLFHSIHAQQLSTGDKGLVEKIPVGFIVNKTSHHAHVWNTKRCVAFAACRWWSATVCVNKQCMSVSVWIWRKYKQHGNQNVG